MSLYSVNPKAKIRKENWGGLALMPSGKLILLKNTELFLILANFKPTEFDDENIPASISELISLGLILKATKDSPQQKAG